jgi:hypothetical protein
VLIIAQLIREEPKREIVERSFVERFATPMPRLDDAVNFGIERLGFRCVRDYVTSSIWESSAASPERTRVFVMRV